MMARTGLLTFAILLAVSASETNAGIPNKTQEAIFDSGVGFGPLWPCYLAVKGLEVDIRSVEAGIQRLSQRKDSTISQLFLTDVASLVSHIHSFEASCDSGFLESEEMSLLLANEPKLAEVYFQLTLALSLKSSSPAQTFISGVIKGLEQQSETKCSQNLEFLNENVFSLVKSVNKLISGDFSAVYDIKEKAKAVEDKATKAGKQCDFLTFFIQLDHLLKADGYKLLFSNLAKHADKVFESFHGLMRCSNNYSQCGFDLGQLLQAIIDWGI